MDQMLDPQHFSIITLTQSTLQQTSWTLIDITLHSRGWRQYFSWDSFLERYV